MPEPGWADALVPSNMHSIKLINALTIEEVLIFKLCRDTFVRSLMKVGFSIFKLFIQSNCSAL
jgi:hypothetical protein